MSHQTENQFFLTGNDDTAVNLGLPSDLVFDRDWKNDIKFSYDWTLDKDLRVAQLRCARECVRFIRDFINNPKARLVLDDEGRILKEYRNAKIVGTSPNLATMFCVWAHQHLGIEEQDFIHLEEIAQNEYREYPDDIQLKEFDPPDRKYIALAYKHPEKPPIVEASDSKWWGIKEALKSHDIDLLFIDEEYIKKKFMQKIGS